VGQAHLTTGRGVSTSRGRLGWRICLRKGCGRRFQAQRHNQRYCQDPECMRAVRRWHAAKRQRKRRSQSEGRQRHAEAERRRRKQRASQPPKRPESQPVTANTPAEPCAWSRSRRIPEVFCDRPGCYELPRDSPRAPASYCSDDCRAAMRRARDCERKCLRRKTEAGRFKRRLEYQAAWAKRRESHVASGDMAVRQSSALSGAKAHTVLFYRCGSDPALDLSVPTEVTVHDPQANPGSRPRAPPTS
jgi:hypothetical protein